MATDESSNIPDVGKLAAGRAINGQLDLRLQNHNAIVYASLIALTYLAMAWFPVITAWLFPQARLLKPMMSFAYGLMALSGAVVAVVILVQPSKEIIIGALLVHAALLGCANGVTGFLNWEALNRGVSEKHRGKALGLDFGLGPTFAVIRSLGAAGSGVLVFDDLRTHGSRRTVRSVLLKLSHLLLTKIQMRRNIAFLGLISSLVGLSPRFTWSSWVVGKGVASYVL